MKRLFVVLAAASILSPLTADSAVQGDINGDGKIDTTEAIYALQVSAGLYPGVSTSCLLSGKGDWSSSIAYVECDVVFSSGENYVCNTSHTPSTDYFGDDAEYWDLLSLKGEKGDTGDIGQQGIPGEDGLPGTNEWSDDTGTVTTSSSVGIGTTSPNESLEIGGSGRVFIGDGGGSDRSGLLIDANETGNYVRINPYDYQTGSNMDLYISSNTGFGTSTPGEKLEITGNLRFSPGSNRQIQLPDGTKSLYIGGESSVQAPWALVNRARNKVTFVTEDTERVRVDNSGNVGIGTQAPETNLHVSSGTSGDATFLLEADTDNNNEADQPFIEMRQDGGRISAKIGFDESENNFKIKSSQSIEFHTGEEEAQTVRASLDTAGNFHVNGDLIVDGIINGNVLGTVNVNQITGLLGDGYTLRFPDIINNYTKILLPPGIGGSISSCPTSYIDAVVLNSFGYETERITRYDPLGNHRDIYGVSMETPFIFEVSGTVASDLKTCFDEYFANPTLEASKGYISIFKLDGITPAYAIEYNSFSPTHYEPGTDGRTRFTMSNSKLPDSIRDWTFLPISDEAPLENGESSFNRETDKYISCDLIVENIYAPVTVSKYNRTLSFPIDNGQGKSVNDWVSSIVEGDGNQKFDINVHTLDELNNFVSTTTYSGCFPIKFEVTGLGRSNKVTSDVIFSYDETTIE